MKGPRGRGSATAEVTGWTEPQGTRARRGTFLAIRMVSLPGHREIENLSGAILIGLTDETGNRVSSDAREIFSLRSIDSQDTDRP